MKHAVITGGSSGIGLAIARLLWQQRYHLTLIARDLQKLQAMESELRASKIDSMQKISVYSLDVSDAQLANQTIQATTQALGDIDLVINCAGICTPGQFIDQPVQIFQETMAVNYFGSVYVTQAVLPQMLQRQMGQVVCIASGVGLIGLYGYASYSPTKFALRGLAESLRAEMKPYGIGISIVYPPDTDTPQLARENLIKPEVTKKLSESAQILSPEEVAQSVINGLSRKRFMITPGLEMTLLSRLHSLIHPVLNRYFDGVIAKVLS